MLGYDSLRAELTADPASIGYAAMAPDEIIAAMQAHIVQVERFVPLKDLQSLLMEETAAGHPVPVWWVLKSLAQTSPLAEMAFDMFSSRLENFNSRGAFQAAALTQLQTAGVIDQRIRDLVDALAVVERNRGEALFGRLPTTLEVQVAMLS
jgi:hypothetical protein